MEPVRWTRTQLKRLCENDTKVEVKKKKGGKGRYPSKKERHLSKKERQPLKKERQPLNKGGQPLNKGGHQSKRSLGKFPKRDTTELGSESLYYTPPPSETELGEEDKWKDYTNLFHCDQCGQQIHDFRL